MLTNFYKPRAYNRDFAVCKLGTRLSSQPLFWFWLKIESSERRTISRREVMISCWVIKSKRIRISSRAYLSSWSNQKQNESSPWQRFLTITVSRNTLNIVNTLTLTIELGTTIIDLHLNGQIWNAYFQIINNSDYIWWS